MVDDFQMNQFKQTFEDLLENDMVQKVLVFVGVVKDILGLDYVGLIIIPLIIHLVFRIISLIMPLEILRKPLKKMADFSFILLIHSCFCFLEMRLGWGKELSWVFTLIYTSYELVQIGFLSVSINLWAKQINHYLTLWYFGNRFAMFRYYGMLIAVKVNFAIYSFIFPNPDVKKEKSILSVVLDFLKEGGDKDDEKEKKE